MALTRSGASVPMDFGEVVVNRLSTMKRVSMKSIVICLIRNRKSLLVSVRKLLLLSLVLCFSVLFQTQYISSVSSLSVLTVFYSTLHGLGVSLFFNRVRADGRAREWI